MNTKDRLLTARAANAADVKINWPGEPDRFEGKGVGFDQFDPLRDGVMALWLAVSLHMQISPSGPAHRKSDRTMVSAPVARGRVSATVMYGDDPQAATRRAIVECAAAIDDDNEEQLSANWDSSKDL